MLRKPRAALSQRLFSAVFLPLHRLQRPNPLLYRHFPAYLRSFAGVSFRSYAMSDPNPQDLNPQDPKSQDSKPSAHKSESGFQYSLSNLKPAQPLEKIT